QPIADAFLNPLADRLFEALTNRLDEALAIESVAGLGLDGRGLERVTQTIPDGGPDPLADHVAQPLSRLVLDLLANGLGEPLAHIRHDAFRVRAELLRDGALHDRIPDR